jgi:hypothetical protein
LMATIPSQVAASHRPRRSYSRWLRWSALSGSATCWRCPTTRRSRGGSSRPAASSSTGSASMAVCGGRSWVPAASTAAWAGEMVPSVRAVAVWVRGRGTPPGRCARWWWRCRRPCGGGCAASRRWRRPAPLGRPRRRRGRPRRPVRPASGLPGRPAAAAAPAPARPGRRRTGRPGPGRPAGRRPQPGTPAHLPAHPRTPPGSWLAARPGGRTAVRVEAQWAGRSVGRSNACSSSWRQPIKPPAEHKHPSPIGG